MVSDWGMFSLCSASCGAGTRSRSRTEETPAANGGLGCGTLSESIECNEGLCPFDCVMDDWSSWGDCSKTCGGGGVRTRTRSEQEAPRNGGALCGVTSQDIGCDEGLCPVNCTFTSWQAFSPCTRSCGGGTHLHKRTVIQAAVSTGTVCPSMVVSVECNSHECPVDCVMNPWGPWDACTKSCNTGTRSRTRTKKTAGAYGGKLCVGVTASATSQTQAGSCNAFACPVDCIVGAWTGFSDCSHSCGGGIKHRTRAVVSIAKWDGHICLPVGETVACEEYPCPIDCSYHAYGNWSACSVSCGSNGITRAYRSRQVRESYGGASCPPDTFKQDTCNMGPCPVHCDVTSWTAFGQCSKTCGTGWETKSRSVTTQPLHGGEVCPHLSFRRQCKLDDCASDCVESDWGGWSACTTTCGGGVRSQTRRVIKPAYEGGAGCGALMQSAACNIGDCPVDCVPSLWGLWSGCTVSCGVGATERIRTRLVDAASGGVDCPSADLYQTSTCHNSVCPIDCTLSARTYTNCTKECGGGTHDGTATLLAGNAGIGSTCPPLTVTEPCNVQACAVCTVTEWEAWGTCSKSCGTGGLQSRTRNIIDAGNDGNGNDAVCPDLVETANCGFPCEVAAPAVQEGCTVGGHVVPLGWWGKGHGAQFCNLCKCGMDGVLSCTSKACGEPKYAAGVSSATTCSHTSCQFDTNSEQSLSVRVRSSNHEEKGANHACKHNLHTANCACSCWNTPAAPAAPTASPTLLPTNAQQAPTIPPTPNPSASPTIMPTASPTASPTSGPTPSNCPATATDLGMGVKTTPLCEGSCHDRNLYSKFQDTRPVCCQQCSCSAKYYEDVDFCATWFPPAVMDGAGNYPADGTDAYRAVHAGTARSECDTWDPSLPYGKKCLKCMRIISHQYQEYLPVDEQALSHAALTDGCLSSYA